MTNKKEEFFEQIQLEIPMAAPRPKKQEVTKEEERHMVIDLGSNNGIDIIDFDIL